MKNLEKYNKRFLIMVTLKIPYLICDLIHHNYLDKPDGIKCIQLMMKVQDTINRINLQHKNLPNFMIMSKPLI
jgi:hypothetical protein